MKLGDWMTQARMTHEAMAELCDCDTSTITRLIPREGKKQIRLPSYDLAARIKQITGGQVTPDDFLPEAAPTATVKPQGEQSAA